jgi:hypothetical protein
MATKSRWLGAQAFKWYFDERFVEKGVDDKACVLSLSDAFYSWGRPLYDVEIGGILE